MFEHEIYIYTRIDLLPWDSEKFYAYVFLEEMDRRPMLGVWLYREGCGETIHVYSTAIDYRETATKDYIKALDRDGHFDLIKEQLLNYMD